MVLVVWLEVDHEMKKSVGKEARTNSRSNEVAASRRTPIASRNCNAQKLHPAHPPLSLTSLPPLPLSTEFLKAVTQDTHNGEKQPHHSISTPEPPERGEREVVGEGEEGGWGSDGGKDNIRKPREGRAGQSSSHHPRCRCTYIERLLKMYSASCATFCCISAISTYPTLNMGKRRR